MGFLEALTILFVALKLFEVIDWSWWLVFAPMYVYIVVFAGMMVMAFIAGAIEALGSTTRKRK